MRLKSSIRVCMEKQERYATELAREQCSRNRLVSGLYEVSQGYLSSSARINFHTQSVQLQWNCISWYSNYITGLCRKLLICLSRCSTGVSLGNLPSKPTPIRYPPGITVNQKPSQICYACPPASFATTENMLRAQCMNSQRSCSILWRALFPICAKLFISVRSPQHGTKTVKKLKKISAFARMTLEWKPSGISLPQAMAKALVRALVVRWKGLLLQQAAGNWHWPHLNTKADVWMGFSKHRRNSFLLCWKRRSYCAPWQSKQSVCLGTNCSRNTLSSSLHTHKHEWVSE